LLVDIVSIQIGFCGSVENSWSVISVSLGVDKIGSRLVNYFYVKSW
jgi:hypothetical protein